MNYQKLLYILEKVKARCANDRYAIHSSDRTGEDLEYYLQLEQDGLIERYGEEEHRIYWKLPH